MKLPIIGGGNNFQVGQVKSMSVIIMQRIISNVARKKWGGGGGIAPVPPPPPPPHPPFPTPMPILHFCNYN